MKRALIIVDLQNDFCPNGALPVKDSDKIIPVINNIVRCFDVVVASKDWHPQETEHFRKWPVHCVQNSFGSEFHNALETDKIEKIFYTGTSAKDDGYSAFEATNEDLTTYLKEKSVNKLYVCGLALDYCVKETAMEAVNNGFETFIILDATKPVEEDQNQTDKLIKNLKNHGINFIYSKEITENQT